MSVLTKILLFLLVIATLGGAAYLWTERRSA